MTEVFMDARSSLKEELGILKKAGDKACESACYMDV